MQSNPKIIVLKTREIIYTLLLILFLGVLILCLVLMFTQPKQKSLPTDTSPQIQVTEEPVYTPGVYTTPITLGENTVDVEVTVDSDHINSIRLVNLSDAAAVSFPLVSPALDHIASQILEKQSLEDITAPVENRYTSQLLLSAVAEALELASKI